jgi:glycosyltransferase involved in cell wall biosynthesis
MVAGRPTGWGLESHILTGMPHEPGARPDGVLRILYPESLTVGGAERQLLLLAEHLPKDRFEVNFILLGRWTDNADLAVAAGANVRALGASNRLTTPMPIFIAKVAGRTLEFARICRRERYDIVDAWLYMSYGLAAVTRPITRVPILITGRRSLSKFKESFDPIQKVIDRIARRSSDAVVANSDAVADDVALREGIDRASIRVIRNGVRIPEPLGAAERTAMRRAWGAGPDDVVIGCVGSMKRGKGQDRVVELIPSVAAAVPTARLVLIGGGPLQPAIEARVAALGLTDRVVVTGDVADARPFYDGFDILVSASDAEGLPNSVLEAAAAGIGIVATDAGGTREIVADGVHGLLLPVPDDAGLGAGIVRLAQDPALRQRLGGAARDRAAAAFSIERFVRETAALYEEMVARRARSRGRLA